MKNLIYGLLTGLLLTGGYAGARAQVANKPFVHPGMMQSGADLQLMKRQVLSGQQPWKDAFDRLKSTTSAGYITHPVTHLSQGPYGADDRGGRELLKSAEIAYNCALLWYITGEKPYAETAVSILNAWSYNLWDMDGNNAKLLAGLSGHYFLNAAEILRYTGAGWQAKDIRQFKKLMLTVYYPLIKDFFPEANGNWDASMINTMLDIAVFCDDRTMFNRAVEKFYRGNGNGGITKYVYPDGQIQEATRDWGHVQLGLGEFAKAAQVAWTQGVDFYSVADNRLAQGFEYASKYMLGEKVPVYGIISERERNSLRDIYEAIYNHYHDFKGIAMPYTWRMVQRTLPKSSQVLLVSLRTLPGSQKIVKDLPAPGTNCIRAGAQDGHPSAIPADAIRVQPGSSVQEALDGCKKGGWVVLLKGVHSIKTALKIPSGVTLAGEGSESILFLASGSGAAVINGEVNAHDISIRDLLIEGAVSTKESEDPNSNRRIRASQLAPARAGIVFAGNPDSLMRHIMIDGVTVQNCTQNGVYISGAADVVIRNCDLSDNGSAVAPGTYQQHNLNLFHVANCQISGCRLDDSPWGSGVYISCGEHIRINGNEAARNKLNGIDCADVTDLIVSNNLTEGNDRNGIELRPVTTENTGNIGGNTSRNNGERGVAAKAGKVNLSNNTQGDNGISR